MKFKEYLKLLEAGGQSAGTHEIDKTPLESAIKYFDNLKFDVVREIPDFKKNYKLAQSKTGKGQTKRKDMPVISPKDVNDFKQRLEKGSIDITHPFFDKTNPRNPFPEGLSGKRAKEFVKNGLFDGDGKDDKVKVVEKKSRVGDLNPIQKQIYLSKSLGRAVREGGLEKSRKFLTSKKNISIISKDNFIIDGHHRFLTALLIDPDMKVETIVIDLSINTLLKLSLAYGDAIGNKRNEQMESFKDYIEEGKGKKKYSEEEEQVDEEPTNVISKGKVDITPHFDPKKKKKRNLFAGHDIFEVDSDMFAKVKREKVTFERMAKHFSIEDGVGADIHKFNRTHPYAGIVLQDNQTGAMMFFKRKRNPPVKE